MEGKTAPPPDLPDPLICGPTFPDLRLVMRHGKQHVESRSNENVATAPHLIDSTGTLRMSAVVNSMHLCCADTHARCDGWCPLVARPEWIDEDPEIEPYEGWAVYTSGDLFWDMCPAIQRLRGFCQTEPQRRFFDLWCSTFAQPLYGDSYKGEGDWDSSVAYRARGLRLAFPALIPEVWLNYLGPDKTADDELHLSENPSRVDFVMVADGKKVVIEIDGKSHYADYHRDTNRWIPDERRYTRNLKIERSLRRQGWEIFRFSDWEVQTCPDDHFEGLVRDLPDGIPF